jgi:hypothetical protein
MSGNASQRRIIERAVAAALAKRGVGSEAPPPPPPTPRPDPWLLVLIADPLFLAFFAIFVGTVGITYTPALIPAALLLVMAFHRVGVVKGKPLVVQLLGYVVVSLAAFGSVYGVRRIANPSKPPLVDIQEPIISLANSNEHWIKFASVVTNLDSSPVHNEMMASVTNISIKSPQSEDLLFVELRQKLTADDPDVQVRDQLPGVAEDRFVEAQTPFSVDELAAQFRSINVLYVAGMVLYTGSDGHQYASETCVYFVHSPPIIPLPCKGHNVSGVRQR